ncbi:carboxypeptidase regulatory-like domain-containing protein [Candidatus Fermentibacteria bacterium]|nr:carboxypeptidase regulatory-like domain-containing protein [Candidatus Fermentibacteria bacterium]
MLLLLVLVGVLGMGAASEAHTINVVATATHSVTLEASLTAHPGQRIPLGFVAAPGGIEIHSVATSMRTGMGTTIVETGEPAMIRELRVVPLIANVPTDVPDGVIDLRIDLRLDGVHQGMPPFRGYLPQSFAELIRPYVLNWDQIQLESRSPGIRYLFVCTDELAGSIGALFDWKERKGLAPQMATLSQTGSTDSAIRQYIRDIYNTSGTLEYVLLVGDHPALPTHDYYNPIVGGYLKSDRYYGTFVGNDELPDVFVGRLPAAGTADLAVMIDKILSYESGEGDGPWMERGTVSSGAEHPTHPGTKRIVRDWLLNFGYDEVDSVFAPSGTAVQLLQKLNDGRNILNYRGGVADRERLAEIGWTQDYCYFMQNGPRRPLVTSIICLTGDFTHTGGAYGECLGESFMRAAGGAIAFFGATHITHTYANNTLDLGIYDGLAYQGLTRIGPITDAGLYYLTYNYPPSDTVTVTVRQYNLLGDPELALWTREPSTMNVSHPSTVPTGTSNVAVSTGVSGSLVCLRGAGVYEAGYADGSGTAYFQITPSTQDAIEVTVTHPGFFPYQGQMTIAAAYTIGGTVRTESGAPLSGAVVSLTGSSTGQVTTGGDGTYAFSDLAAGGNYTVTPTYSDIAGAWPFSPQNRTYSNLQADQWGQDFTGSIPRYTIGGTITSYASVPMEGVTVNLSGFQQAQTTTNAQGSFQFSNLLGAETYTITPTYTPQEGTWSFEPQNRTVQLLNSNHWAEDFVGTPPFYTISGTVRDETNASMEGVRVVLAGEAVDTTTTSANGSYSFSSLAGGRTYTVTPSYDPPEGAWTFTPPSYQFDPLTAPQTNRDFTGVRPRYAITGSIAGRDGEALPGVAVHLSGGWSDSTFTSSVGTYSFEAVPGGLAYQITPSLAYDDSVSWGFFPQEITIANLMSDLAGQTFVAQLPVRLCVGVGSGAPGSTGNPVDIELDNETYNPVSLDSLCFTLVYSAEHGAHVPVEGGVELAGRAEDFVLSYHVDETVAAACSVVVTLRRNATSLVVGTGAICNILFSLEQDADTAYATTLSFAAAAAWDTTGFLIPVDHRDTGMFGTGVHAAPAENPSRLLLHPPVPNPAAGEVAITFSVPRSSRSTLLVRDLTGRVLSRMDLGVLDAGEHGVRWHGVDQNGTTLPNGTYHCQLVACGQSASNLIVLLR